MPTQPPLRRPVTVHEAEQARRRANGRIDVVDDDPEILDALQALLTLHDYAVTVHGSASAYLAADEDGQRSYPGPWCVLCDVKMPDTDGLALLCALGQECDGPVILMSGLSGAREVVTGFHGGAFDFLIKPLEADVLLATVDKALAESRRRQAEHEQAHALGDRLARLTERERAVARLVLGGKRNQEIADTLGIALRTAKLHRQRAMEKLCVDTLAGLMRELSGTQL